MSLYNRARRQRVRDFQRLYSDKSLKINDHELWQVHEDPKNGKKNIEIDFWIYNNKDVSLTTLRNDGSYIREVSTNPRDSLRFFVGIPFERYSEEVLNKMVDLLKSSKLPKRKRR